VVEREDQEALLFAGSIPRRSVVSIPTQRSRHVWMPVIGLDGSPGNEMPNSKLAF
jgi:hypothetical protein